MSPLLFNPLHLLAGATLAVAMGFGTGWTANGWRLGQQVAEVKAEGAKKDADASKAALEDLVGGIKVVKESAERAQVDVGNVNYALAQLRKDFKNANPPPLPPDCMPDPIRVRALTGAATATDQAIARPKPGGAVQTDRSSGITQ